MLKLIWRDVILAQPINIESTGVEKVFLPIANQLDF